jgi:hypothetical protein
MKEKRNAKYAARELELAKAYINKSPLSETQRDRIAYWSAYLGNYETAREYAVSDYVKEYIKKCENS